LYDSLFCRLYNEFGWNEYPRVLAEQILQWLRRHRISARTALDLGCGTGVLCEVLHAHGLETLGLDLSPDMVAIARERCPGLRFEVANMVHYRSESPFDLVTCTGDAINHIFDPGDVRATLANAYLSLAPGGHLLFDLLRADEVPPGEPFEADGPDGLRVRFLAQSLDGGRTRLRVDAFEGGRLKFSETILEKVHPLEDILSMLREAGFEVVQCADRLLLDSDTGGTTWFIVARRPEEG